jgi:LmbE family N-acetylglucosaminyl deacetylase
MTARMATLVCFHAHPDDEAIATGGTIAGAVAAGHRVVLVSATRGEHGEVPDGFLAPGESLGERRSAELVAAAEILGVHRLEFLGYVDSGMAGTPTNDAPESFWRADPAEAAERLAAILRDEAADVLTVYDENGVYGHPDHVQVHRVGVRAAALAGVGRVYESTVNRDFARERMAGLASAASAAATPSSADGPDAEAASALAGELAEAGFADLGVAASAITTAVDVGEFIEVKRRALAVHASQIGPDSWFLRLPEDLMRDVFGTEWYVRHGSAAPVAPGDWETDLFEGLA